MKIQVLSDLHQEFGIVDLNFSKADLVIFAGDINLGIKGIEWIKANISSIPVLYILGNHEYYKGSYPKTLNKIANSALNSNIHVLENKSVVINNITFHGATLWTDFQIFGNPRIYGSLCQEKMNDYKKIRRDPSYSKLRSIDTFQMHLASLAWLEKSLTDSSTNKNIVITHHAPSMKSVPIQFREDPVSAAYASNLESVIETYQPDYWIHGHIHSPVTYNIGKSIILSNPHGYVDEPYNGFKPELLIEV